MTQTALPVIEKLDPYQFWIQYKLFRDATRSVNGQPVKVRVDFNTPLCIQILIVPITGLNVLES